MQNEILKPVLATDETAIPRYDIVNPDGSVAQQNVELRLKNEVMQQGTPYDEESVLPATLREKLGLPNSATPSNAFEAVLAKAGAKVSMNAPTQQDNVAAGYSIGAMWVRPKYTLYNLVYDKSVEDFIATACVVTKDNQTITATGNGDDKVISISVEHGSETGWLYCVVTPHATAVSARVIAGVEDIALTPGEANVIKHKYSGTSITFEATYATANDANTSTIVIDNLTVIDEAATLEQVDNAHRDITDNDVFAYITDGAPFKAYSISARIWCHTNEGVWYSNGSFPQLTVVAPVNTSIKCINGDITLNDSNTKGASTFEIPKFGNWSIYVNDVLATTIDIITEKLHHVTAIDEASAQATYIALVGNVNANMVASALGKNNEDRIKGVGLALAMYARYLNASIDINSSFYSLIGCNNFSNIALSNSAQLEIVNSDALWNYLLANDYTKTTWFNTLVSLSARGQNNTDTKNGTLDVTSGLLDGSIIGRLTITRDASYWGFASFVTSINGVDIGSFDGMLTKDVLARFNITEPGSYPVVCSAKTTHSAHWATATIDVITMKNEV